jgi:hypothetical protein
VPVCYERNTIARLNGYEGRPEARPFSREELQLFLDYAGTHRPTSPQALFGKRPTEKDPAKGTSPAVDLT